MFQTFRNAWKIPELKNRLLFTLAILVVYRLGCVGIWMGQQTMWVS